jgi:hypothetical protein
MSASVDKHGPAGMAQWLRERARVNREWAKEPPPPPVIDQHHRNVMPHFALRFEQAAEMIERLARGEHICTRCYHRIDPPTEEPTF